LKAAISRTITRTLTNPTLRDLRWSLAAARRKITGSKPVVHYFHQPDDPYSHLAASLLPQLQARYKVRFESHIVPPPSAENAPDLERLREWSERDAQRLASHYKLIPVSEFSAPDGGELRNRLGHYLGATFYFEGEWYWGIDRLHYLERRLADAGLATGSFQPLAPPPALQLRERPENVRAPVLHYFCSLRSPYTWIATPRIRQLADHYGAELKLRFVLPMVMRGLPVPLRKRLYILRDTKREAERLGLPFGMVADPVGMPTERGLAVLHYAVALNKGPDFLDSFLRGVFAEGIDAGTDNGLHHIAQRAGITSEQVNAALADNSWRDAAETNRSEMLTSGLWGVPSFRIDDRPALWGQDRIWMLEQDLIASLAQRS
jgi:2-hydroxychromene-2-carboxylate isomerase